MTQLSEVDATTDTPVLPGQGLTLAQCRTDLQCRGKRACLIVGLEEPVNCAPDSPVCVCIFVDGLEFCSSSDMCPRGEVCASGVLPEDTVCASRLIVNGEDGLDQFDTDATEPVQPSPVTGSGDDDDEDVAPTSQPPPSKPSPPADGELGFTPAPDGGDEDDDRDDPLTLDNCSEFGACRGRRLCVVLDPATGITTELCASGLSCVCSPPSLRNCVSSADCVPKEICASGFPLQPGESACVSRAAFGEFDMDGVFDQPSASPPPLTPTTLPPTTQTIPLSTSPRPSIGPTPPPDDTEDVEQTPEGVPSVMPTPGDDSVEPNPTADSLEPVDIPPDPIGGPGPDTGVGVTPVPDDGEDAEFSPAPDTGGVTSPAPGLGASPSPAVDDSDSTTVPGGGGGPPVGNANGATPAPDDADDLEPSPVIGGETPAPSEPPICVDARALAHMKPEELVFERHNLAKVLCDGNDSCATPGHMVDFKGRVMMMRTYCEMVPCEQRKVHVNSPKFRRRLRVKSRTDGLHYTAFAARFATRGEEMALSTLSRIGL